MPVVVALPLLAELAAFLLAFAFCILAIRICRAFFGTVGSALGWIPWLGSKVEGPLHSIEQKVTSELGAAAHSLDVRVGQAWHTLAGLVRWAGREIEGLANDLLQVARAVGAAINPATLQRYVHALIARIEHEAARAKGEIAAGIRPVTSTLHGFERWTTGQIRALAHTVDVTLPGEIAGLRKRTRTAERTAENAWKWIKAHQRDFTTLGASALVAAALARLGASWIRCRNWNRIGKQVCATDPSLIEDLLSDVLVLAGIFSVVEFARDALAVEAEAMDALRLVIREFPGH